MLDVLPSELLVWIRRLFHTSDLFSPTSLLSFWPIVLAPATSVATNLIQTWAKLLQPKCNNTLTHVHNVSLSFLPHGTKVEYFQACLCSYGKTRNARKFMPHREPRGKGLLLSLSSTNRRNVYNYYMWIKILKKAFAQQRTNRPSEETAYEMEENICELLISLPQRTNNHNIWETLKTQ